MVHAETWLSTNIANNEIMLSEWNYTIYLSDRPDNHACGGVMIAISKQIPSYEVTSLQTNCELLWVQITAKSGIELFVDMYYRPHIDDHNSIIELDISLKNFITYQQMLRSVWLVILMFPV